MLCSPAFHASGEPGMNAMSAAKSPMQSVRPATGNRRDGLDADVRMLARHQSDVPLSGCRQIEGEQFGEPVNLGRSLRERSSQADAKLLGIGGYAAGLVVPRGYFDVERGGGASSSTQGSVRVPDPVTAVLIPTSPPISSSMCDHG